MPSEARSNKVEGTNDYAFTDDVIELHGNTAFMRCVDFCNQKWYKSLTRAEVE